MTRGPILIVDDDPGQRRIVEFWLQEVGYTVVTAPDGLNGLKAFQLHSPSLVITDMRMPHMSGLDLMAKVKAINDDTPVIVITAFGTVSDAVDAMRLGAADYILKPINADELKLSVSRIFERQQLVDENRYLRDLVGSELQFSSIIGNSRKMRDVFAVATQVARRDSTVLITGESGTGKEILAKAIHQNSLRAGKPFITVNCGALPETLVESELFGHTKGAFTGAAGERAGKFETANEGTIFLDEVGELPLAMQVKLLRVLQEREVDKLGSSHPVKVNVRIIAATNRDLKTQVEDGDLREDLYYRLSVITIQLPPLRERREDIPALIAHFLRRFAERYETTRLTIGDDALDVLQKYDWPGNIRELENVIERLSVLATGNAIGAADLPAEIRANRSRIASIGLKLPDEGISLEEVEKEILVQALEKHHWNQTRASRYLNISRKTLIYRMEKFGLVERGAAEHEAPNNAE
ncbi:MAG: sigma-54 dependent transcriptional regulator [Terriglobia bacterium]|jgi:two-component system NtrC family response regulator|nr:sigma-54 dependent transcriptional regulator [Terriglobia bacterium]